MRAEKPSNGVFLRAVGVVVLLAACLVGSRANAAEPTTLEVLPPLALDPLADAVLNMDAGPDADAAPSAELVEPYEAVTPLDDEAVVIDDEEDGPLVSLTAPDEAIDVAVEAPTILDNLGYHTATSGTNWLIAHDNRFGMVSFDSSATLAAGEQDGIVGDFGFHFLDGPVQTDMPPRLFDFVIGYQRRRWISPVVGYDIVARVGAYSDFETSARKGVRFPGHAVAQIRMTPDSDVLLGVDVLDRDDISLLPVVGLRWMPNPEWQLDLVFPRPKVAVRVPGENAWAYLRGELGGGTWAIERVDRTADNATYRDLRLAFGIECFHKDNWGGVELAYVFGRDLSYRSGVGDFAPEDAVMFALVGRK